MTAKTLISWATHSVNPVKGLCPVACEYCYARKMYKRYKWNEAITFRPDVLNDFAKLKAGSRVFVGSTMELFGPWVRPDWLSLIFDKVKTRPDVTFIFLTKQPWNLKAWSPFPTNVWVGMTTDNISRIGDITDTFASIKASVKFCSFEPMLDYTPPDLRYVDWVIIGCRTQPTILPVHGVIDLINRATEAHIPVFVKEPLFNFVRAEYKRQELPEVL